MREIECVYFNFESMGEYDYPTEELKQTNRNAYLMQKNKAQGFQMKLAEFKRLSRYHAEQSRFHLEESEKYLKLYNELKAENE